MAPPKTPLITVDIIIRPQRETGYILLIERRHSPSGWALPGGFVDAGESLEAAAVREAKEETGLNVELELLLGCYSNPNRDPRGPTVSATYVANAQGEPTAADDAKDAKFADPADQSLNLAFDHRLILDDYLRYIKTGEVAPLRKCRRSARR
jgi:8-oxo-dGTP diphosphatase